MKNFWNGKEGIIEESKKGYITCGSCELRTEKPTDEGECSNCRSGNWVWGDIENKEKGECDCNFKRHGFIVVHESSCSSK